MDILLAWRGEHRALPTVQHYPSLLSSASQNAENKGDRQSVDLHRPAQFERSVETAEPTDSLGRAEIPHPRAESPRIDLQILESAPIAPPAHRLHPGSGASMRPYKRP